MTRERILQLLCRVIDKEYDEISKLADTTVLTDIGLDSISFIQFIVLVEEEYKIEILDSDLMLSNFETIGTMLKTLAKYFSPEQGALKKVLVCDCDNVLWHGISGEESIIIDESVHTFQKKLLELYDKGVLLCLCTKNDRDTIEHAFADPGMLLPFDHFVSVCFSTDDKSRSIQAISEELGLSLDSFVFADDSDYELGLIHYTLPEVKTVKIDYENLKYIDEIQSCFPEGKAGSQRTEQYREQKEREKNKALYSSVEEYNASLNTSVVCETATAEQSGRIAELSQRTNKFNLSGKRYDEAEISDYISDDGYVVISLSASDKYGDMGIVGASVIRNKSVPTIMSFNLSCRAFGRGFESVMIEKIKKLFEGKPLYGVNRINEKNRKFSEFFIQNGIIPV